MKDVERGAELLKWLERCLDRLADAAFFAVVGSAALLGVAIGGWLIVSWVLRSVP